MIKTIFHAELRRLLRSPMLWLVYAVILFILSYLFLTFLEHFRLVIEPENIGASQPKGVTNAVALPVVLWAGILLLAVIPLFTAAAISEARKSGRWILLTTSPARPWQIITGLYLAHCLALFIVILLVSLLPLSLYSASPLDTGKILYALFSLWLMTSSFLAAGIYCSTLHKDSSIVILLSYSLLMFLFVLQLSSNMPGVNSGLLYYLSHWGHFSTMLEGRFSSIDITYYIVFMLFFLLLATYRVSFFSRSTTGFIQRLTSLVKRIPILFVFFVALWLSLQFPHFRDVSSYNNNTLDQLTTNALLQMPDKISVTAVVEDKPELRRQIKKLFIPYRMVKKNLELTFSNLHEKRLLDSELSTNAPHIIFEYQQRKDKIHAVNKTLIAKAIRKLHKPQQKWAIFLEGHGERSIFEKNIQGLTKLHGLLKQQDYQIAPLNLIQAKAIPDNTTILIIAAPTKNFLEGEIKILIEYINRGGNLLWLHDQQSMLGMDKLSKRLSIKFQPGIIVDVDKRLREMLGIQHPAVIPVVHFGSFEHKMNSETVLLPLARGVENLVGSEWSSDTFLFSMDTSWNETDPLEGHASLDKVGERQGPHHVGINLTRLLETGEQRVAVIGDIDLISNDYIGLLGNSKLTLQLFDWLSHDSSGGDQISAIPDARLELSQKYLTLISVLFLIILPMLLIGYGAWQWRKLKHRR